MLYKNGKKLFKKLSLTCLGFMQMTDKDQWTATASSYNNGHNKPEYAIDGTNTMFHTQHTNTYDWLQVRLQQRSTITMNPMFN
jgi:hypothetical protein